MDYAGIAAVIAAAVFWWKGAEMESVSPFLWVGLSLATSAIAIVALHGSWGSVLIGQVILFVGIAVLRVMREQKKAED